MNILTLLKLWGHDKVEKALARVIRQRFTKTTYDQVDRLLADAHAACEDMEGVALAEAITELLFLIR